jgi:hypothetical protein
LKTNPGLPGIVRDLATDYLCFIQATFRLHRPVVSVLADALRTTGYRQILDLCSGGGGPILQVHQALNAAGLNTHITLTDRFPNLCAFQRLAEASQKHISFISESVDARCVPDRLKGLRTIFNSFHHFCESDARGILRAAVAAREPIAIFEYPERAVLIVLLTMILTPFLVALATPFIRPFRWQRIFLTYLLPMIPLTCWWDGIISQLRAYAVDELKALVKDLDSASYEWRAETLSIHGLPGNLTYLLGHPR